MYNTINSMAEVSVNSNLSSNFNSQLNSKIRTTIRIARSKNRTKVSIKTQSKKTSWKELNLGQKAINFQLGLVSRREFIDNVSSMILFVPKCMKCYDYDIRYDFYLEIISNIEKIIKLYKQDTPYTFQTWFINLLKKRFISFMRIRNLKFVHLTNDALTDIFEQNQKDDIIDFDNEEYIFNQLDLSELNEKELELIKAKYGFYSNEEAQTNPIAKEHSDLQKLKNDVSKKITRNYTRLLDIQFKIQQESNPDKIQKLQEIESKLIKYKRSLENRLSSMKTNTSIRDLANYFNLSKNTINKYILSAEKKIYKNNIINL